MKAEHNLAAWKQAALEIGLRVDDGGVAPEVEITSWDNANHGILWVSRLDILKIEPGDSEVKTIDAGEALAVMDRLYRAGRRN